MTVGSRSIRMMAILFVFNSILAAVALFNMYSVAEQVRTTAEIQYSQFLGTPDAGTDADDHDGAA